MIPRVPPRLQPVPQARHDRYDRDLDRRAIAETVKERRLELGGRTIRQIATDADVSPSTVDRILAARPAVSRSALAAVSVALWGSGHHDALTRVGRGHPPVKEPPRAPKTQDDRELDRRAIADAFSEKLDQLGRSKKRVADDAGLSTRTLDRITAADSMVSTRVLSTVSAAMWGASHHDALVRAGRGQAPVDEPPSLAERLARVEARLDELVQLVKQAESYRLPF